MYIGHKLNITNFRFGKISLGGDNIFKCLAAYFILFLLFFSFFGIAGYKEYIPGYMLYLQFFYFIFYTGALLAVYKIKISRREFYWIVFIYSVICSLLVRQLSWEFRGEPFLGGIDSQTYNGMGSMALNKDLPYSRFLAINSEDWGIDDQGMSFIIYLVYKISGSVIAGQYVLLLLNSLFIAGCAWRLDGLMKSFQIERKIRRFLVAVYAFFPFLSLTAGVGLKENFFLFIIISSFYYMYRWKEIKSFKYFLFTSLCIIGCVFFRAATFAMMILSFFICIISTPRNGKKIMRLMILGAIVGALSLGVILTILFGRNLETFLAIAAVRSGRDPEAGLSITQWIISTLAIFFGPFPNFAKVSEYAIVHSAGVLMKGVLGFPILWGLWNLSRRYISIFYPLLVYFVLNMLMAVLVNVSLDMRYQIPFFPLALPFAGKILQEKELRFFFLVYIGLLFILIFFYNRR